LRKKFHCIPDPVEEGGELLALKFGGYSEASLKIEGEYQIMPILIGRFWEVEHSAMYKPDARLRGVANHPGMVDRRTEVLQSIKVLEEQFERLLKGAKD
jgi:hypothetical protein